jgi:hypothetical protein
MSNDGRFWSAKINDNGQIVFFRGDFIEGAAYYHDKPELYKYLVLEGNRVHEVSQEQKDAIDAAEQQAIQDKINQDEIERLRIIEEQAIRAEAERIEQERLAEEAAIRNARLDALRVAYRNTTNLFCEMAEINVVDKIEDPSVIINAVQGSTGDKHLTLFELSMQIKFLMDELRRPCNDGDDAWERI